MQIPYSGAYQSTNILTTAEKNIGKLSQGAWAIEQDVLVY